MNGKLLRKIIFSKIVEDSGLFLEALGRKWGYVLDGTPFIYTLIHTLTHTFTFIFTYRDNLESPTGIFWDEADTRRTCIDAVHRQ